MSSRAECSTVAEAASIIAAGGIVVFPTETVYGIGADARDTDAVKRIFEIKGRPPDNPLIVHIASSESLRAVAELPTELEVVVRTLLGAFSPGPLTLVLPVARSIPPIVTAGLDTVAVRVPSHPIALALLHQSGCPIAAPSANRSGAPSPTTLSMARSSLTPASPPAVGSRGRDPENATGPRPDAWLDGGACEIGLESTVVRVEPTRLHVLRPGAITAEALAEVSGRPVVGAPSAAEMIGSKESPANSSQSAAVLSAAAASPGMRHAHYRPRAEVVLFDTPGRLLTHLASRAGAEITASGEHARVGARSGTIGVLLVGSAASGEVGRLAGLATVRAFADIGAYARGLYSALVELDSAGATRIYAQRPASRGLGVAIADRLERASGSTSI